MYASQQVYGVEVASLVASSLVARNLRFTYEPQPHGYFRFEVRDEGDNARVLKSLVPPGRPFAVTLTHDQKSTTHNVTATEPREAMLLAVGQRYEGDPDGTHLLDDEETFDWSYVDENGKTIRFLHNS
jgi:hypothetical protein